MFKTQRLGSFYILFTIILSSCTSKKNILNIQDIDSKINRNRSYVSNKIQVNELLDVNISSLHPEAAVPCNLVYKEGFITSSLIGYVKAIVKSIIVLEKYNKPVVETGSHLNNFEVSIRILNSKITILVEVNQSDIHKITQQNISVLQVPDYEDDLTYLYNTFC